MHAPYSTTMCNLYCLWVGCPCLSLSAVAMCPLHRLCSVFLSCRCWVLAVALHWQGAGHKTIRGCSLSLRGISKCACFKFSMAARNQASKKASKKTYTHTCAMQSLLVWGSLRLAPIKLLSELYTPTVFVLTIMWYRGITLLATEPLELWHWSRGYMVTSMDTVWFLGWIFLLQVLLGVVNPKELTVLSTEVLLLQLKWNALVN